MENNHERDLLQKLSKITEDVKKINKDKSGYNFTYEDPEAVQTAVYAQLVDKKVGYNVSVMVSKITGLPCVEHKEIKTVAKSGVEKVSYASYVTYEHIYTDLETGFSKTYIGIGSGIGDQPGQADGAAGSYARRQEFEKRFAVTIKKEERSINTELKYTIDADGETAEIIKDNTYRQIMNHIAKTFELSTVEEITKKVAEVIKHVNKELGTTYQKLKVVPEKYSDDIVKSISVLKNTEGLE